MSDLSNQELIRKIVESLKRTGRRFGPKKTATNRRAKIATQPKRKSAAARTRSAVKRKAP
jgi:hypothetical protein